MGHEFKDVLVVRLFQLETILGVFGVEVFMNQLLFPLDGCEHVVFDYRLCVCPFNSYEVSPCPTTSDRYLFGVWHLLLALLVATRAA